MRYLSELTGVELFAAVWLPEVLLVLAGGAGLLLLAGKLLGRLERAARQTETVWDDALIHAVKFPFTVLLAVVALAHAASIIDRETGSHFLDYAQPARAIGVIACLAWFLIRLINRATVNLVQQRQIAGESIDRTTADALSKLGRISVLIIAALTILQSLGFSISGVLAFSGIGGIAVGFAAKDLLANFFGGLMIYLDRPFSVGEWIRSPDKAIEGTVEYIGWRQTRIRAFNKNPIYVPNSVFTSIVVENPSRMSHRRIKETIGIRYQDIGKMAAITADVKAMLLAHPEIDHEATLIVNFTTFSASSIDFMIYTFTTVTAWVHYQEIKQDILLKVAAIIAAHGAEIAFPTRTLHIERDD